jgi:predicted house-cleaning noncanonical NTP pyrophosphatase (MazG superfamily)
MVKKYKYLEFEKLVRDKNPDTIIASGGEINFEILSKERKIQLLKEKLVEEANEVLVAENCDEIAEEIGDVLDVLHELIKSSCIKNRKIRKARRFKAKQRGKFKNGVYCHYVKFPVEINEKWMKKYKDITSKIENKRIIAQKKRDN